MKAALATAIVLFAILAYGHDAFRMPPDQFARFRNRAGPKGQGSCVYASISIAGAHGNMPSAENLLWPSPYGPPLMDGSWPERIEREFAQRNIPIYNVEGSQTLDWIDWALDQGHYAAITYGVAHMITAVSRQSDGHYDIVDNNFPTEVRRVTRAVFIREHRRYGGGWAVILRGPAPPPWQSAATPLQPDTEPDVEPEVQPAMPFWSLTRVVAVLAAAFGLGYFLGYFLGARR